MSASYLYIDGSVANMYKGSEMVLSAKGGAHVTLPANNATPPAPVRVPVSADIGSITIPTGPYQGYYFCAAKPDVDAHANLIDVSVVTVPGQTGIQVNWIYNGNPQSWRFNKT